jgi:hypothetical protein
VLAGMVNVASLHSPVHSPCNVPGHSNTSGHTERYPGFFQEGCQVSTREELSDNHVLFAKASSHELDNIGMRVLAEGVENE